MTKWIMIALLCFGFTITGYGVDVGSFAIGGLGAALIFCGVMYPILEGVSDL